MNRRRGRHGRTASAISLSAGRPSRRAFAPFAEAARLEGVAAFAGSAGSLCAATPTATVGARGCPSAGDPARFASRRVPLPPAPRSLRRPGAAPAGRASAVPRVGRERYPGLRRHAGVRAAATAWTATSPCSRRHTVRSVTSCACGCAVALSFTLRATADRTLAATWSRGSVVANVEFERIASDPLAGQAFAPGRSRRRRASAAHHHCPQPTAAVCQSPFPVQPPSAPRNRCACSATRKRRCSIDARAGAG